MSGLVRRLTGYCAVCGEPTKNTIIVPPPECLPEVTLPGYEFRCKAHTDDAARRPEDGS